METIFDNEQHVEQEFLYVWWGRSKGFAPGGFSERLINAFIHADGDNFRRLASVYPAYAKAYNKVVKGEQNE